ncbi:MAG: NAD(P)H-dependent flavin oxidoreductase [Candidatus Sumerlaeia bacterium]
MLEKLFQKGKDFLGVQYPIICGAMTWVSTYELVKAVSDNGAFPVLAGGNMPPDLFEQEVDKCIQGFDKPFAVNLITIAPNYRAHYDIVREKDVPFVVFAANFPKKADVVKMKEAGKKTMAFASTKSIAQQMIRFGIDALILEGSEAGGHIGHVSLTILLQQVLFEVRDFPVFVGGGLATGKMLAHILMMGAYGGQFGTIFAMSEECPAHAEFKNALKRARARQAVATPEYDSRLHVVAVRALKNKGMDEFGRLQLRLIEQLNKNEINHEKAQYEVENFWMGTLRRAVQDGDVDTGSLMAGQSVGLVNEVRPMRDIIQTLVEDCEGEIKRVHQIIHAMDE